MLKGEWQISRVEERGNQQGGMWSDAEHAWLTDDEQAAPLLRWWDLRDGSFGLDRPYSFTLASTRR